MRPRPPAPALLTLCVLTLLAAAVPALRAARPTAPLLPPSEEKAKDALEHSPRNGEYVDIPYAGHAPLRSWVVYPERSSKAGVVLVIHEVFGLSDWIRAVGDRLPAPGGVAGGAGPLPRPPWRWRRPCPRAGARAAAAPTRGRAATTS